MQHRIRAVSCVSHIHWSPHKAHSHGQPVPSAACWQSEVRLLQRQCPLGPSGAGHRGTRSQLRAGSHVPCAHQDWMLGSQQFPQSAAWRPSSTFIPGTHRARSSSGSSAPLCCPAQHSPELTGLPGHRGMLAPAGTVINSPISSATPVQPGTAAVPNPSSELH